MYRVCKVDDQHTLQGALAVRTRVFIEEQGVDPQIEIDGLDDTCTHVVAWYSDAIVGTARLLPVVEGMKVGRMAVLPAHRGKGVGGQLLQALMRLAAEQGAAKIVLHAQVHAVPFYLRHGFTVTSPEFLEAGIMHVCMEAHLAPKVRPGEVAQG